MTRSTDGPSLREPPPMVERRPAHVSVAAGMTIAMGVFFAFTAIAGAVGMAFGDRVEPPAGSAAEGAETSALGWLSAHGALWMASYAAIAGAAVSCGVAVWLRKRWARRGCQLVMSFCAALFVVAGALLGRAWRNEFEGFGSLGHVMSGFWWLAAFGVGLAWAGMTALPVWLLARREAREWFEFRP